VVFFEPVSIVCAHKVMKVLPSLLSRGGMRTILWGATHTGFMVCPNELPFSKCFHCWGSHWSHGEAEDAT
jgi:hypothetical protein